MEESSFVAVFESIAKEILAHLDFFIAAQSYKVESALRPFAKRLIEKELEISRTLEQIHFGDQKFDLLSARHHFQKSRGHLT